MCLCQPRTQVQLRNAFITVLPRNQQRAGPATGSKKGGLLDTWEEAQNPQEETRQEQLCGAGRPVRRANEVPGKQLKVFFKNRT